MTATALYQWIFRGQDVPSEVRKDALARVGVHALLVTVLIGYLCQAVPIFAEIYSGFSGKLPPLVQILIDHADFTIQWFYLIVPAAVFGLVADYRYYIHLYLKSGQKSARWWAYGVTCLLSSAIGFYIFALSSAFGWVNNYITSL